MGASETESREESRGALGTGSRSQSCEWEGGLPPIT